MYIDSVEKDKSALSSSEVSTTTPAARVQEPASLVNSVKQAEVVVGPESNSSTATWRPHVQESCACVDQVKSREPSTISGLTALTRTQRPIDLVETDKTDALVLSSADSSNTASPTRNQRRALFTDLVTKDKVSASTAPAALIQEPALPVESVKKSELVVSSLNIASAAAPPSAQEPTSLMEPVKQAEVVVHTGNTLSTAPTQAQEPVLVDTSKDEVAALSQDSLSAEESFAARTSTVFVDGFKMVVVAHFGNFLSAQVADLARMGASLVVSFRWLVARSRNILSAAASLPVRMGSLFDAFKGLAPAVRFRDYLSNIAYHGAQEPVSLFGNLKKDEAVVSAGKRLHRRTTPRCTRARGCCRYAQQRRAGCATFKDLKRSSAAYSGSHLTSRSFHERRSGHACATCSTVHRGGRDGEERRTGCAIFRHLKR